MNDKHTEKQYKFGRTKPGGTPAMRIAIPIGLAVAIIVGIVIKLITGANNGFELNWTVGIIIGLCLSPFPTLLAWALLVDRSTLPQAAPNTEDSIESAWYSQSANDAFHLIIVASGIGAALASFLRQPSVSWTLIAVFACAASAFAISYLIRKRRATR